MNNSRRIMAACAVVFSAALPLSACGENSQTQQDASEVSTRTTPAEPMDAEHAIEGYKQATAALSGSANLGEIDDPTLERLFEIYYTTMDNAEQFDAQGGSANAGNGDMELFGDYVVEDDDKAFINEMFDTLGLSERIFIPEDDPARKADFVYFAVMSSISGDAAVAEEAAASVDEMLEGVEVKVDTANSTAAIPLPTSTGEDLRMRYDNGVWKLDPLRKDVAEMSDFGIGILTMIASEVEGDTPEQKATSMVSEVREFQREVAADNETEDGAEDAADNGAGAEDKR